MNTRNPPERPGPRAALRPFAWLAVALVGASLVGVALQALLAVGPDAGAWNPTWRFAEVRVPGLATADAHALAAQAAAGEPRWHPAVRDDGDGAWVVLVGPDDRQALLTALRDTLAEHGHPTAEVGFGSNLGRIALALRADPGRVFVAVDALLPATLLGGGVTFLVLGGLLRRRLPARLRAPDARTSAPRRVAQGLLLGLVLAGCIEALSLLMERLGAPIVEQAWLVELVRRGGLELHLTLPLVVLLVPLAEEVFFRGYLLEALRPAWGRLGSLLASSVAFAAVHGHAPALPAYVVYGVGLGLAARRTETLLVPVVAHVTVNGLAVALLLSRTS